MDYEMVWPGSNGESVMIVFHLIDQQKRVVREFTDKQDAYEYQNRVRPDTYLKTIIIKKK